MRVSVPEIRTRIATHQAPDMHDVGGADESGILACAVNAQ